MGNVKIVTDSTADIPSTLVKKLNITVVPLNVIFGQQETYEDGVDIDAKQFYQKLESTNVIPTTSQPTPHQFEKVYKEISVKDPDTKIISIHISSKLSGTYQSAFIACDMVKDQIEVTIIDSKKASYGIGLIVVEMAKLADNGASYEECMERLEQLLKETKIYFIVDTLNYLQKNGRIGKASAIFGSLLKIKPILSLNEDGEVFPYDKVRGQKKALGKMYQILEQEFGDKLIHVAVLHANSLEFANQVSLEMESRFKIDSKIITDIGPVIGAHVGPGTIGITATLAK
ncbi:DegV family protein [Bacillaceae bacterium IKA-2]|jgi:DegV family protein with EDD domain|nr:DegV family protein [Bacillaceae bacterium IKA-2]